MWAYNLMVNNLRSKYIFVENEKIEILFSICSDFEDGL